MKKKRIRGKQRQAAALPKPAPSVVPTVSKRNRFIEFYDTNYKRLLWIPFIILLLAVGQIAYQAATTGEFVLRGVSLKGGTTVTIPTNQPVDLESMRSELSAEMPGFDFETRILSSATGQVAVVVETDASEKEDTDRLLLALERLTGMQSEEFGLDVIGPSLGQSFFREIIKALLVAFVFMGIAVFIYFRAFVPSAAVILAAASDIIVTVAIVNIIGMKLSTAGVAAFLMLIGYSIDTDILLSTRVVRRKEGTVFDRVLDSAKTGLTMTLTTLAAVTIVFLFTTSEILSQIMAILLIGLLADIIFTWIQNVGLLRLYMERVKNE